jgi:threonyl-tRNA synthetase
MPTLEEIRHSASHIMATAVLRLFPQALLDIGPCTDTGFYYDFDLDHKFTPEDLEKIEKEMRKIVAEDQTFTVKAVSREEAQKIIAERKQETYKLVRLADIPGEEKITFYQNGEFVDLCAGPHVKSTKEVKALKLLSIAGAYHKGDEKNKQLQRIYGTAFPSQKELDEYLKMVEEAKKRDHRKIGQEMAIYTFNSDLVGPGLPLWLPNGAAMCRELENLAYETEFAAGYVQVKTPHIAKEKMYTTSGHLPYYADSMFAPIIQKDEHGHEEKYYLKAMNCPHHHCIYSSAPRSYRDLPLRLTEYGTCYRYEQSGELFGLMRVRCMNMNDAHIYCTPEQFAAEFQAVNDMYLKYFKIFGIKKYVMRFSTHDPARLGQKYVNEPELWKQTEDLVRKTLTDSGIKFVEVPNEAAFYGPKMDVEVWSAIGKEFTLATNQVDFAVPARFGLTYRDANNQDKTPLCIHRAPLSVHERYIGFLIEHFAGNFPAWLAPEQVRLITITDAQKEYGEKVLAALKEKGIRATLDDSSDKLGGKIRKAETQKVPYMWVLGGKEAEAGNVAIRCRIYKDQDQKTIPLGEAVEQLVATIKSKRLPDANV